MDKLFNHLNLIKARFKKKIRAHIDKEKAYLKRLLFPLKLFPLKLMIYFIYYPIRISWGILIWSVKTFFKAIIWPFRKWSNFFKAIIWIILSVYLLFSLLVILDYMSRNYGSYRKFWCGVVFSKKYYNHKIVRIIGGYGQGSGFFIDEDKVITNFHVIDGEPSPKIIFPGGNFITPVKIEGDKSADIAVLYTNEKYPEMTFEFLEPLALYEDEPLIAFGYALGTDLKGEPTNQKGRFVAYREGYIQSDINLIGGMSGGPLIDQCGQVVGINTMGLSGLSMFIASDYVSELIPELSEQDIAKITVDPTTPEGAVTAFYTYLKTRNMEEGFKLLSKTYLEKTNFREWTNRFTDVLDVEVYITEMKDERTNTVFVKFSTKNWVNESIVDHFYEGTWETVPEDGIYKMNRSNIKEVFEPDWSWFYSSDEF
jgi:hypothetical protein